MDCHYKASGAGVNAAESFCPVDCLSTEREGLLSLGQLSQPPFCLTLPIWGKLIPDLLPPRLMTRTTRTNLDIQWAKWLFPQQSANQKTGSRRPKTNESIPERNLAQPHSLKEQSLQKKWHVQRCACVALLSESVQARPEKKVYKKGVNYTSDCIRDSRTFA